MSLLVIAPEDAPAAASFRSRDPLVLAARLAERGVRFEQWATRALPESAGEGAVLHAYAAEIRRLQEAGPYPAVDVVRLLPPRNDEERARAATAREKFRNEHTHDEDEVRFFVEGRGLFYLRLAGEVCLVLCEAGDLLGVPAGTRHWFDMGEAPHFTALRFFGTEAGWVARFTGDAIAARFPSLDDLASAP